MDYQNLGKRIREERKRLNMTQAELAEKIQVTPAYIGQIERGEKSATLSKIVGLANAYHVTVDYLLQDYVDGREENTMRLIIQYLHDKSAQEKEMAYRMLIALFDCYESTKKEF